MRKVIATVDVTVKIVEEEEDGSRRVIKKKPAFSTAKEFLLEDLPGHYVFGDKLIQATLYQALADLAESGGGSVVLGRHLEAENTPFPPPNALKMFKSITDEAEASIALDGDKGLDARSRFRLWVDEGIGDEAAWNTLMEEHPEAYAAILAVVDRVGW